MRGVCVYHLNRCKTSDWFSLICRGVQSTVETAPNEAIHLCWKQSLINSVYLQNLVSTLDQAVTLRCFESTRLPQSVLHASEPSSDCRRNHIADSIMFFDLFSPRPCRRRTMGYFGKQSPKHYFGFPHAGQNSMESGYDYVWQFRMPYIVCEKYLMWLFYSSNNLGWFACFRIQFLPDHIMIHSCLVCVCVCCVEKGKLWAVFSLLLSYSRRFDGVCGRFF